MMKKKFYPSVFTKEGIGYSVRFPDLPGCYTEGDTLEEACSMAEEALGLYLENSETGSFDNFPASEVTAIKTSENECVVLIGFDEIEYRKRHNNKDIKKTLSIPEWLNIMAEENNINFSQVLQKALKAELNLTNA